MFERLRELISIFLTSLVFMLAGVAPATGSLSTCERSSLKSGTFNGANHFPLVVTEADGTVTTKHVDLLVENSAPVIHSYDANGNLESVAPQAAPTSPTRTYQWDAANRLVGITRILSATEVRKTEFLYNGMGARVGKKELLNGSVESDIRYFYGGTGVLQERTADGGTVTKTYTPQGEQSYLTINNQPSTINLYHTRDHLGSVREVVAEDGTLVSRYDYKPYGERVLVSGTYESSKGYTGHDYHADSGLALTRYRAYDPSIGRWLNPDPLEEAGGMNLYGYVSGDPVNAVDPLGLAIYSTAPEANKLWAEWGAPALAGAAGGLLGGRFGPDAVAAAILANCGETDLAAGVLNHPGEYIKDATVGAVVGVATAGAGRWISGVIGKMIAGRAAKTGGMGPGLETRGVRIEGGRKINDTLPQGITDVKNAQGDVFKSVHTPSSAPHAGMPQHVHPNYRNVLPGGRVRSGVSKGADPLSLQDIIDATRPGAQGTGGN